MVMPGGYKKQLPGPIMPVKEFAIINVPMPSADTEYSWQWPKGLKRFTLHVRDGTPIRISDQMGKVAGSNEPYWTLVQDCSWSEWDIDMEEGLDYLLYFACGVANKVVEIIVGIGA